MLRVWKRSPLLRVLLPFIGGILLEIHSGVSQLFPILLGSLSLIFFCAIHWLFRVKFIRRAWHGISIFILSFCLGLLITDASKTQNDFRHILYQADIEYDYITLRLTDTPVMKKQSLKVIVEALSITRDGVSHDVKGSVILYIKADSLAKILEVDDTLLVRSKLSLLNVVQNPLEFNYKEYLQNQGVHCQLYASENDWKLVSKAVSHSFLGYFISWRENLLEIMRSYDVEGQEYAVLSALVLGKTSEIDYRLMLSYASTGTIHILAVSGLHVALIYTLLKPIFRKVFPKGKYKLIRTLIPCLILWLYAGITGFSPSVLRAALMFTCFIVADNYSKDNNIYNTMSASALLLLWWSPYMITELGFQLSYLAVLGIVVFQRKIVSYYYTRNNLIRYAWELTSVSLAAQLTTLSLGLFYFHQFPNWFLLSNLIIIPISSAILFTTLAFFVMSWCPPVATVLICVSNKLTFCMNSITMSIDKLPFNVIQGINITVLESLLIAAITGFLCYHVLWKTPKALLPALLCLFALGVSQSMEKSMILKQREVCIHNIPKHTCITYAAGQSGVIICDNDLLNQESRVRYHLKNYWDRLGIKDFVIVNLDSMERFVAEEVTLNYPFLRIADIRFTFLDSLSQDAISYLTSDYVLLNRSSKGVFLNEDDIVALTNTSFILGNDVSAKKKAFIKENFDERLIHDLDNGALIIRNKEISNFSAFY